MYSLYKNVQTIGIYTLKDFISSLNKTADYNYAGILFGAQAIHNSYDININTIFIAYNFYYLGKQITMTCRVYPMSHKVRWGWGVTQETHWTLCIYRYIKVRAEFDQTTMLY